MNTIGPFAAPLIPTRPARPEGRNAAAPPPPEPEPQPPIGPNPRLRLDAGLGVVVLEFMGAADTVVRSLPNEQELRAYRLAQRTGGDRSDPPRLDPTRLDAARPEAAAPRPEPARAEPVATAKPA